MTSHELRTIRKPGGDREMDDINMTFDIVKTGDGYGLTLNGVLFDTGYETEQEARMELDYLVSVQSTKH